MATVTYFHIRQAIKLVTGEVVYENVKTETSGNRAWALYDKLVKENPSAELHLTQAQEIVIARSDK